MQNFISTVGTISREASQRPVKVNYYQLNPYISAHDIKTFIRKFNFTKEVGAWHFVGGVPELLKN